MLSQRPPSRLKLPSPLLEISALSRRLIHKILPPKALCTICQSLRFSALRGAEGFVHGLPEQIVAAARNGCPFCTLLEENFDLGPKYLPVRLHGVRRNLPSSDTIFVGEERDIEAIRVVHGYDYDFKNPFAHRLALWTYQDDPAAMSVKRRPFIQDFASDDCLRLLKSWLDACIFHHQACTTPIVTKLPTRVIDVGTRAGAEPALFVSSPDFKSSYIALSYCWGTGGKRVILTKEMSEVPNLVFPMNSLPTTIRDAVDITRRLGIRFIWIDALCIIQQGDDGADFRRENATMHKVYGDATLTLAAVASNHVDNGIYRCPVLPPIPRCEIPYDFDDGSAGTVNVIFEDNQEGESRIQEPLNTRGWTFQERVLPPRVVLFYQDQLSWECDSIIINSNGPLNPLTDHNKDSPGRYSDYVVRTQDLREGVALTEIETYMAYWRKSIEFYSRRNFTHESDKLKAISGCAQWIKAKTNDTYMAGLWLSDLRTQLFWYADERSSSSQKTYRAPSWSWASVNGRVKFLRPTQFTGELPNEDWTAEVKIEKVTIEYGGDTGEFGDIIYGHLFISGVLRTWRMFKGEKVPSKSSMEKGGIYFDNNNDETLFWLHAGGLKYFLFYPLFGKVPQYFALILKRMVTTYKRVGMLGSATVSYDLYHKSLGGPVEKNIVQVIIIE